MARARLYGWNGERPEKPVTGQQQIVLFGLSARKDEMHTGHEWAELLAPQLATRQDPYRVVLYYILRLKACGCIRTAEREIDAVTRVEAGKHAITVKTDAEVVERAVLAEEPETEEETEEDEELVGAE